MPHQNAVENSMFEVTRYTNQQSAKWRSNEIFGNRLGITGTSESQSLFDSGYIGDNGVQDEDLRLHVYTGSLLIDTAKDIGKDINVVSNRDFNLETVSDINMISINNTNLRTGFNYTINVLGNHEENVRFNKIENILGPDGYEKNVTFGSKINIGADYDLTVNKNYTLNTINGITQINAANTAINTSDSFNVNSVNNTTIFGKVTNQLKSDNLVEINTPTTDIISDDINLKSKNINSDYRIVENYNISAQKINIESSESGVSSHNKNYDIHVGNKLNITAKEIEIYNEDENNSMLDKIYIHRTKNMIIDLIDSSLLKAVNIELNTENRGNVTIKIGNQQLILNNCIVTINDSAKMIDFSDHQIRATKVWNAVYN